MKIINKEYIELYILFFCFYVLLKVECNNAYVLAISLIIELGGKYELYE